MILEPTTPAEKSARQVHIHSADTRGLLLGFVGVVAFSLTLPMTRLALVDLDVVLVGFGRSLVAALIAGTILLLKKERLFPERRHLLSLLIVASGVIIGFPLFSALAMREVPAVHGAVVAALLPLATALAAVIRANERPSRRFWMGAVGGSTTVVLFLLWENALRFQAADGWLVLAVATCSFGYAEGGRLAREIGGWRVISWALVISAPVLCLPVAWSVIQHGAHGSAASWVAFGYLGSVSMFAGFCAWYAGLAIGGVARVSQIQLLQPFLTFAASALLLHEGVSLRMVVLTMIVIGWVALGRRSTLRHSTVQPVASLPKSACARDGC